MTRQIRHAAIGKTESLAPLSKWNHTRLKSLFTYVCSEKTVGNVSKKSCYQSSDDINNAKLMWRSIFKTLRSKNTHWSLGVKNAALLFYLLIRTVIDLILAKLILPMRMPPIWKAQINTLIDMWRQWKWKKRSKFIKEAYSFTIEICFTGDIKAVAVSDGKLFGALFKITLFQSEQEKKIFLYSSEINCVTLNLISY